MNQLAVVAMAGVAAEAMALPEVSLAPVVAFWHVTIRRLPGVTPHTLTVRSLSAALNVPADASALVCAVPAMRCCKRMRSTGHAQHSVILPLQVQGQQADLADLQRILNRAESKLSNAQQQNATRWAVWQACSLLRAYTKEHQALIDAMKSGASVADCVRVIESA